MSLHWSPSDSAPDTTRIRARITFHDAVTGACLSGAVTIDGRPDLVEARIFGHRGHVAKLCKLPAERVRITRTDLPARVTQQTADAELAGVA